MEQKTVEIGTIDGETRKVTVNSNATVAQALQIAGFSPTSTQHITAYSNSDAIEPGENVVDGETYLLTENVVGA